MIESVAIKAKLQFLTQVISKASRHIVVSKRTLTAMDSIGEILAFKDAQIRNAFEVKVAVSQRDQQEKVIMKLLESAVSAPAPDSRALHSTGHNLNAVA